MRLLLAFVSNCGLAKRCPKITRLLFRFLERKPTARDSRRSQYAAMVGSESKSSPSMYDVWQRGQLDARACWRRDVADARMGLLMSLRHLPHISAAGLRFQAAAYTFLCLPCRLSIAWSTTSFPSKPCKGKVCPHVYPIYIFMA